MKKDNGLLDVVKPDSYMTNSKCPAVLKIGRFKTIYSLKKVILSHRVYAFRGVGSSKKDKGYRY